MKFAGGPIVTDTRPEEATITEEALLRAAQAGDRLAMSRLLAPHQPSLYSLCRGMLGQAEDAEDAVQETFYRAIRALPQFRPAATVHTWLFRIAMNVCLDWRQNRRRTVSLDIIGGECLAANSVAATILTRVQLDQALAELLPRHRAIFLLREEQGWSVEEIAVTLHCTQRRVNNELYKARRTLKEWAQRQEQEGIA